MTRLLLILFASITLSLAGPRDNVLLSWNYPSDELSTDLTFVVYTSTNITIPLTNWPVLTNVIGTNLSCRIPVVPGKNYFVMKATNWLGESDFSNVAQCVVPRSDVNLRVTKDH